MRKLFLILFFLPVFLQSCTSKNVDQSGEIPGVEVRAAQSMAESKGKRVLEFDVFDTDMWIGSSTSSLYWLDGDTLIFSGSSLGSKLPPHAGEGQVSSFSLIVWSIKKQRHYQVKGGERLPSLLCRLKDNFIYKRQGADGVKQSWLGEVVFKEGAYLLRDIRQLKKREVIHRAYGICELRPTYSKDKIRYLSEIDSYINFETVKPKFITNKRKTLQLPFTADPTDIIKYSNYANSYIVFEGLEYKKREKGTHENSVAYLINGDGVVASWDISQYFEEGTHKSTLKSVVYTRTGLVVYTNQVVKGGDSKAGHVFYLIDESGMRTIFTGHSGGMVVSKDGCKLALQHREKEGGVWWDEKYKRTLKIINLCKDN